MLETILKYSGTLILPVFLWIIRVEKKMTYLTTMIKVIYENETGKKEDV